MSGGHFDYVQYRCDQEAESLSALIEANETVEKDYRYSDDTIIEFKKGLVLLRTAAIYLQRIDWLVSGDDGEETFHHRLKEDLEKFYAE